SLFPKCLKSKIRDFRYFYVTKVFIPSAVFISNMSYIHLTNLLIRYKACDSSWGLLWHSLLHVDERQSAVIFLQQMQNRTRVAGVE
ncbi:hypothetical protein L9F63_000872, partial [Diploptera punctata]